ncbi:MAG TPA: transketolase family protein [Anaerolineae bacterium]|nr:transketolase family protein [Anaerolineae bacterium]HIQ05466.1 transketolase family protein [Anaerolineae bacterium]
MEWEKSSLREALGKTLVELGSEVPNMLILNADLRNSVKTVYFMREYPERTIEVGIAEQNMIGVAAGLAMMGFIPFAVTFARFASKRAADQISMSVDYCRNNVKIIGAYAGIFTGRQGVSQQMIDDTAAMRAMPNMTVIETADVHEIRAVLHFAVEHVGPLYIRVGRDEWPVVFDETYEFHFGKGTWLREGGDVVLMNSGILLPYAIEAAEMLKQEGIDAGVINMPTIKPIDVELINDVARNVGAIVTVENHNILGGFGGAVAEVLVENYPVPMERIGIRNEYSESAPNDELAEKHRLTAPYIAAAAQRAFRRKQKYWPRRAWGGVAAVHSPS